MLADLKQLLQKEYMVGSQKWELILLSDKAVTSRAGYNLVVWAIERGRVSKVERIRLQPEAGQRGGNSWNIRYLLDKFDPRRVLSELPTQALIRRVLDGDEDGLAVSGQGAKVLRAHLLKEMAK